LVLLLLMLLVKHPWVESRSRMITKGKPKNKNKPESSPKGGTQQP
jgi:hypothetical protein